MIHRNDIQGLRAIAVLLVIFAHVGIAGFAGGWIGVDVFFVISGFLITGLLIREYDASHHVSLLQFYIRRAKRILPASLVTIVVVLIASNLLLNSIRAANVHTDALWAAGFVSNIHFIKINTDYFSSSQAVSPLQHFWSLAVGEQFFLIWPALFLLVSRQRGMRIRGWSIRRRQRALVFATIASALSLAWSIIYTNSHPTSAYFSTLTRVWELGFGVLLACTIPQIQTLTERLTDKTRSVVFAIASWTGLAAITLGACVIIKPGDPFPGYLALIPVLGAVGIIFGGLDEKQPLPNRLLSFQPLPFIGTISFSLYLWHWPIHVFAEALYPDAVNTTIGISAQLALILTISLISYYLIEIPTRHLKIGTQEPAERKGSDASKVPTAAITVMCVGAAFLLLVSIDSAQNGAYDAQMTTETSSVTTPTKPSATPSQLPATPSDLPAALGSWEANVRTGLKAELNPDLLEKITAATKQKVSEPCVQADLGCFAGDPQGTKTVAIFGDSHAGMVAGMVADALPGWKVHLLTSSGCTTAFYEGGGRENSGDQCRRDRQSFLDSIVANPPDLVILSDALSFLKETTTDEWSDGQAKTYDLLKPLDGKVPIVHLTPTPTYPNWDRCLDNSNSLQKCNSSTSMIDTALATQSLVIRSHPWITRVDITPLLCANFSCPAVIDGIPVMQDGDRFTFEFRHAVAPAFAAILGQNVPSLGSALNVE